MHLHSFVSVVVGFVILSVSDVTSAQTSPVPSDFFRFIPGLRLPICPIPPRPKTQFIDLKTLRKRIEPHLPPVVNGVRNLTSFRPLRTELGIKPQLNVFKNPFIDQFVKVAPNSTQLWIRREVRNETRMTFPYHAFGKVIMRDGERRELCSGTSVGENLLLTANHCIDHQSDNWSIEWIPAFNAEDYKNPQPFGSAFVNQCIGIRDLIPGAPVLDGTDYVVCELNRPIGRDTGFIGAKSFEDKDLYRQRNWLSVGYPDTFRDGNVGILEDDVWIYDVFDSGDGGKLLVSPQYVDPGWSGGPLFGWNNVQDDAFLVGVVSSKVLPTRDRDLRHIFTSYTNHAGGERLLDLIFYGRLEWAPRS